SHIQDTNAVIAGHHIQGVTPNVSPCANGYAFLRTGGDGSGWSEISKFGALDTSGDYKIYVENNWMKNVAEGIDINDGNRMVIRFNTFINSAVIHHGSDTQTWGARYTEIYGNTFSRDNSLVCDGFDVNTNDFLGIRGGTSFIVKNVINNADTIVWGPKNEIATYTEQIWKNSGDFRCWGTSNPSGYTGAPIPSQVGWGWITGSTQSGNVVGRNMDLEPMYIAANTGAGNYTSPAILTADENPCGSSQTGSDYVHNDVEYYKQTAGGIQTTSTSPFNGSTGTGYGTRVSPNNRPTTGLTNGVAYWATDAGGHWDTTSANSNDGCLDRVVSGAWVDCWYTPLEYPHPFITGSEPPPSDMTPKGAGMLLALK